MTKHVTLDSGKRVKFNTGAQRDTDVGKTDFSKLTGGQWADFAESIGEPVLDIHSTGKFYLEPDDEMPPDEDLIPEFFLKHMNALLARGAVKYGKNNWQRGIPLSRSFASALRHLLQWRFGDRREHHLSAAAVNIMFLMVTEWNVARGLLSTELADMGMLAQDEGESIITCGYCDGSGWDDGHCKPCDGTGSLTYHKVT